MQLPDKNIDGALLRQARAGNREAHAMLYRAYAPMVFTLALRMLGSRACAEDVLQDSFVEVIRKAAEFRGDGDIRGWIKRIAVNRCLSQLRSPWFARRARANRADADEWPGAPAEADACVTGDDVAAGDEPARILGRQQELERALAGISATARAVVWLHDVEGYTHGEIGRLMGRSTSFSKSQLSRAYRELRQILQPDEADSETQLCLGVLKTV